MIQSTCVSGLMDKLYPVTTFVERGLQAEHGALWLAIMELLAPLCGG